MRLEEVLPAFKQGKKIRRRAWRKGYFFAILNGVVTEYGEMGYVHPEWWTEDILADDWEVVE